MKFEDAINLFRTKNFNEAIEVFLNLKKKIKENPDINFYLGLCILN